MPETAEPTAAAKPPRTWRPMVLWTAAILAVAALAIFVATVVVPTWQLRSTVIAVHESVASVEGGGGRLHSSDEDELFGKHGVERLGGPGKAAQRLRRYLRMSDALAPHKEIAVRLLGRCGEDGLPGLVEALQGRDIGCRRWAAFVLGSLGPKARPALPALMSALKDPDSALPYCAVKSIGEIGPDAMEAIPALIALYEHPRQPDGASESWRAVRALGQIDTKGNLTLPTLGKALAHEDYFVRDAAAEALAAIGPAAKSCAPALLRLLDDGEKAPEAAFLAYWRLTGDLEKPLDFTCERLKNMGKNLDKDFDGLRMWRVSWGGADRYLNPMRQWLEEMAPSVSSQPEAIRLKYVAALVPFVLSRTSPTREEARRLAGTLYSPGSPEAMAFDDWETTDKLVPLPQVCFSPDSLKLLGGPERALPKLRLYMKLPVWVAPNKTGAAIMLTYCDEKEAARALAEALANPEVETRRGAAIALTCFSQDGPPVVPALIKALGDADDLVRERVAEALVFSRANNQADTQEVLAALTRALADHSGLVRAEAAHSLISIRNGDAGALKALVECLRDEDAKIRLRAMEVLRSSWAAEGGSRPRIVDVPEEDGSLMKWIISVLGDPGPDAVAAIRALRKAARDDASPEVRKAATEALGKIIVGEVFPGSKDTPK